MKEQEQSQNKPKELLFSEVVRFLKGLPALGACEACGKQSWEIPVAEGSDDDEKVVLISPGLVRGGRAIKAVALSCNSCGLLRSHKEDVISEWIRNNPEPEGSSESLDE